MENKIIYSLIEDIHAALENGVDIESETVKQATELFAADMRFAMETILQEGKSERSKKLRLSMIGKPDRQIWYNMNIDSPEIIDGQTRMKFLMGHLMEAMIVCLAKVAGHKVEGAQAVIEVEGIKGHQDCRIDDTLVDIKTASSFGFKKFKEGASVLAADDPFGYVAQISAYATAQKDEEVAFLAIDKSSCEMALCYLYKEDMIDAPKRVNHLKKIVAMPEPPERCYEPVPDGQSGNLKLATGCAYCQHKLICWADANDGVGLRAFQYSNGVRYLTSVEKEPNVEEIKI